VGVSPFCRCSSLNSCSSTSRRRWFCTTCARQVSKWSCVLAGKGVSMTSERLRFLRIGFEGALNDNDGEIFL